LKSLFKNLIQQTQTKNVAQQVATVRVAEERKEQPRESQKPATAATPRPAIKVSQLGMTWNNLRQQSQPKMQILPGTQGIDEKEKAEREAFSQEDLELQWMSMCNRMPQRLSGIAARMKNMNPRITEFPAVELLVPNEIIKAEVEQIQRSILATLKLYLHNTDITMTLRVAEKQEQTRILSRREQFEELTKENPVVEKLRAEFDLELA
jgi:DNA polymerase-3 subunit gamma/tau